MPGPLKLANLWRIIRDVDLAGVRAAAHARFALVIVSETGADAARLRELLSGTTGSTDAPHPWIEVAAATPEALAATTTAPVIGIVVTREARLSLAMESAVQRFAAAGVPTLIVVVGDTTPKAGVVRSGERARSVVASLDPAALDSIGPVIADLAGDDPQLALAAQLPPLRGAVFSRIIDRTARANAGFAFTTGLAETVPILSAPLNLGDIVVLTKNQVMMCYRIALAGGRQGEPTELIGEILGVLGGGLLFRQAARELVGLIPFVGLLPKVAIAYAGTHAIGRAMVAWITEGRRVTSEVVARYSRESLEKGRALAERMVGDRPPVVGSRLERFRQYLPVPRKRS
jgi:uncharacterized protein (DUF697 family)